MVGEKEMSSCLIFSSCTQRICYQLPVTRIIEKIVHNSLRSSQNAQLDTSRHL
jgi:hypothetical protein